MSESTTVGLDDDSPVIAERYQLLNELGRDRIFVSFSARDLAGSGEVVVKLVVPEVRSADEAGRLVDGLRGVAALNDDHIHPVIDVGNGEGYCYVVEPPLHAPTLRDYLEKQPTLPRGRANELIAEITQALTVAHAHDMAHGNLTLDSIHVRDGRAVISDFCLSIVLDVTEGGAGQPGGFARNRRADIAALGELTYRLLGGADSLDDGDALLQADGRSEQPSSQIFVPMRRRSVDHGVLMPEERRYVDSRNSRQSFVNRAFRVLVVAGAALIPILITAYAVLKLG